MTARHGLNLVIALYVLSGFGYSSLMPPWEAPDEPAHYVLVANLVRVGRFSSLEANYEAQQPQLYYRLAALPLGVLHHIDPSWIETYRLDPNYNNLRTEIPVYGWDETTYRFIPGMYLLRWLNVGIGAAAVAVFHAGLRRLFPEDPRAALSATVFLAFIPQFLHITSTVSNDALGILAGAVLFLLLGRLAAGDLSPAGTALAALAAVVLPLTTKLSALPMGAAVFLAAALALRARQGIRWRTLALGAAGLIVLLLLGVLIFPGPAGDLFEVITGRAFTFFEGAFTWESIRMMQLQLARTFWGQVGWIGAHLPDGVVLVLSLLAGFGIAFCLRDALDPETRSPFLTWGLAAALIGIGVVFRNGFYSIANQGRLLFPSLGAVAFCVVAGWLPRLPTRVRERLPWVIGGLWMVVNLWLIFGQILPVYHQPFE